MYEYYRGPRSDDIITDPDPFEFQVLRITGALYLPGVAPEHDGRCEDHSNHNEYDYQCDAHGCHDSAKTRQQDTGKTRLLVLPQRGRTFTYIDLKNHESVPQSQTSSGLGRCIPGQPILSRLSWL